MNISAITELKLIFVSECSKITGWQRKKLIEKNEKSKQNLRRIKIRHLLCHGHPQRLEDCRWLTRILEYTQNTNGSEQTLNFMDNSITTTIKKQKSVTIGIWDG